MRACIYELLSLNVGFANSAPVMCCVLKNSKLSRVQYVIGCLIHYDARFPSVLVDHYSTFVLS